MCFRPPTLDGGEVKCPQCGASVSVDADECPNCGAKSAITGAAAPPPVPPKGFKVPGASVPKAPGSKA